MTRKLLLVFSLFFVFEKSHAQAGKLDPTFGQNGVSMTTFLGEKDKAVCLALQNDGKILLGGNAFQASDFSVLSLVARLLPDGKIDSIFGLNGAVFLPFGKKYATVFDLLMQADGKILAAAEVSDDQGKRWIGVARLLADGALDSNFDGDGWLLLDAAVNLDVQLAMQPDGKILVGSLCVNNNLDGLARLMPDGTLDPTFGTGGFAVFSQPIAFYIHKIMLRPNGKILLAGNEFSNSEDDFSAVQLLPNGTLDAGFGVGGLAAHSLVMEPNYGWCAALQQDGKLLIGGGQWLPNSGVSDRLAVIRLLENGSLDPNFGTAGKFLHNGASLSDGFALALQSDGKILLGGYLPEISPESGFFRLKKDGTLDASFGTNGLAKGQIGDVHAQISELAVQPDGKILAVAEGRKLTGDYFFTVARFSAGTVVSTLDFSKNEAEPSVFPNPILDDFSIEFLLEKAEGISISLFANDGKCLKTYFEKSPRSAGQHLETLVLPADLAAGFYFLEISTAAKKRVLKVQKN